MMTVTFNKEKNGIELRFETKPCSEIISNLKEIGFRWHNVKKMWYAKQTAERMDFVNKMNDVVFESPTTETKQVNTTADLWGLTRTDEIENNFEKYRIYDTKEIAAIIRKHLRERFSMCKWSVTSDTHSISVDLISSPWEKDSDEVKAIAFYAYSFADSYNYDNSDSMTDYFDVNFYGVYESSIVSYKYNQREATELEIEMSKIFHEKKIAFEQAEKERKERELQEYMKQREIEVAENAKREAEAKAKHDIIVNNCKEESAEYFVIDCVDTRRSKCCTVNGYFDNHDGEFEIEISRCNCKVSKNIYFDEEVYNLFSNQLLDDFSFLSGMGGTATNDLRIGTFFDYSMMHEDERKTVEFFNNDCIAVYCNNELKMIINPEGYDYARYVYFVDEKSRIAESYVTGKGISDEEYENNLAYAESIEDASSEIIVSNNLINEWNGSKLNEYKELIKTWIENDGFKLNAGIIRAITNEELKRVMYSILKEINSLQNQFNKANLIDGQKITIVRIDPWMAMLSVNKVVYHSHNNSTYAQYEDAVRLIFTPECKRKAYEKTFYNDVIVYNDWLDIPDNLLWDITESNNMVCKKSKYFSCDSAQYDEVLNYFKEKGILPIINTYKAEVKE